MPAPAIGKAERITRTRLNETFFHLRCLQEIFHKISELKVTLKAARCKITMTAVAYGPYGLINALEVNQAGGQTFSASLTIFKRKELPRASNDKYEKKRATRKLGTYPNEPGKQVPEGVLPVIQLPK